MSTVDTHQKVAFSLKNLSREDQAWLLQQLDSKDREHVELMLQELHDTPNVATPALEVESTAEQKDEISEEDEINEEQDDVALLCDASPIVLRQALRGEPLWVVALLLARCSASVALREYVSQLAPGQAAEVGALVGIVRRSVRPKVCEAVLRSVAERIKQYAAVADETADLDTIFASVNS